MADPSDMKFDKRIILRNLQSGALTRAEMDSYLSSLPDSETNAEVLSFDVSATAEEAEEAVEDGGNINDQAPEEPAPASSSESEPAL